MDHQKEWLILNGQQPSFFFPLYCVLACTEECQKNWWRVAVNDFGQDLYKTIGKNVQLDMTHHDDRSFGVFLIYTFWAMHNAHYLVWAKGRMDVNGFSRTYL